MATDNAQIHQDKRAKQKEMLALLGATQREIIVMPSLDNALNMSRKFR